jgi:MFS family permease
LPAVVIERIQTALRAYAALDRRVWNLALIRAINTGGLSLVMVFMGIYLVTERGLSMTLYGVIALAANTVQSWTQGAAGILSDRAGRRGVMAAALAIRAGVLAALGVLVLATAPVWILVIALVASASLRGAFEPVAYAFVADVVAERDRVVAFGLQRMGTNLGWAIGPAAGGVLAGSIGYGAVFFWAAPALLAAALLSIRQREPERAAPTPGRRQVGVIRALREALATGDGAVFLAGGFLFALCHVQLFATLSVYAKGTLEMSEAAVGTGYMVNGVLVLALQLPAVALIAWSGSRPALLVGSVLYVVAFFAFGQAAGLAGVAVAIAVMTFGEVLLAPAQQTLVAELNDPERYGRAFGVFGTVQMLGVAVAPLVGGLVYDSVGDDGALMWSILASFPAAMLVAFAWFAWRTRAPP